VDFAEVRNVPVLYLCFPSLVRLSVPVQVIDWNDSLVILLQAAVVNQQNRVITTRGHVT